MNKKYFFFDIDGTLTDRATGKIVPSAQVALNELQKAGHFVAIATGRAHYKARNFMESVGLHDMVCCGGGGLVIHDELVQNIPLDLEKSKAIAKQALSLGYGVLFTLDDSIKVYTQDHTFQNQVGDRKEPTEYVYDENLDVDELNVIYKMYISIPKEKEKELTLKDTLGNLRFVPDYLMFQYDAKHQGILDMMQHVGGVKVGLFFPRSTLATTAERRPSGTSVASTTYHLRSTWPGLAINVVLFMISPIYSSIFVYE